MTTRPQREMYAHAARLQQSARLVTVYMFFTDCLLCALVAHRAGIL